VQLAGRRGAEVVSGVSGREHQAPPELASDWAGTDSSYAQHNPDIPAPITTPLRCRASSEDELGLGDVGHGRADAGQHRTLDEFRAFQIRSCR